MDDNISLSGVVNLGLKYLPAEDIATDESYLRPVMKDSIGYLEMLESIRNEGIQQTILVRVKDDGVFSLIDGLHRLTMAKECGFKEVPCKLIQCSDTKALSLQMQLNLDPVKTDPAAFGRQLKRIMDLEPEITEIDLAIQTNTTLGFIKERLKLTLLPIEVQDLVDSGSVTLSNAVEMLRIRPITEEIIDAAKTKTAREFEEYINYKIKLLRVSKLSIKKPVYKCNPIYRKIPLILEETRRPNITKALIDTCTSKEDAFKQGLLFALSLDRLTEKERTEEFYRKEKEEEEGRELRRKERLREQMEKIKKELGE